MRIINVLRSKIQKAVLDSVEQNKKKNWSPLILLVIDEEPT